MVRTLIDVYGNTGFPGVEEHCGPWYSIFHGWTGIWLEPVGTVRHCSGLRKCVFMVLSSKIARTLTCLHGKTVFPGVEEFLVCGRASPMSVRVSKWSQSALLGIAVGLECAYSWFDLV